VTEIAVLDPTLTRALPAMVEEIASGVRVSILPAEKRLWKAALCAEYLGYTVSHFRQHIATRPDFPKPFQIGDGREGRRWKGADVMAWAEDRAAA